MRAGVRLFGSVGLLVVVLLVAGCSAGQGAPAVAVQPEGGGVPAAAQGVTVTGVGRVSGEPDVLWVTVGVEVAAARVQQAVDDANAAADQVLTALRGSGVADEDIQTREFSVQPEYRYPDNAPPEVTGYRVSNLAEAKVRDLARVGEVLSAAVGSGGSAARVHGVSFALEDNEALLEEARAAALAQARTKAEQYAALAGHQLGELVSVEEATSEVPPPVPFAAEEAAAAAGGSPIPIAPGQQEVAVSVTAVWSWS